MLSFVSPLMVVTDVAASRKFYESVLDLKVEMDLGENISFANGPSIQSKHSFAEMIHVPENSIQSRSHNMELYFEMDEIDPFLKKLESFSIEYVHTCLEMPWGQRTVRFYDPDKHIIEVAEKMETVVVRYLREGKSVQEISEKTMFPLEVVEYMKNSLT